MSQVRVLPAEPIHGKTKVSAGNGRPLFPWRPSFFCPLFSIALSPVCRVACLPCCAASTLRHSAEVRPSRNRKFSFLAGRCCSPLVNHLLFLEDAVRLQSCTRVQQLSHASGGRRG